MLTCSKCGRNNDGSCKFYKKWEETVASSSGNTGRREWIVCEFCVDTEETKHCDGCGQPKQNLGTQWCSQNCLWGKEKKFCQMCLGHHITDLEYHRQNCPIRNRRNNDNNNRERERERRKEEFFEPSSPIQDFEQTYFRRTLKEYLEEEAKLKFIDLSKDGQYLLLYYDKDDIQRLKDLICSDINVREYLKNNNKITLDRSDILSNSPRQDSPTAYDLQTNEPFYNKIIRFYQTPTFWWIAGVIGVIDLIYLYFYFFERKKLRESLKKNTWFKIFSYLLAIASVIILLIPVIFFVS